MGLEIQLADNAHLLMPERLSSKKIFSFLGGPTIFIRYAPEPGDQSSKIVFIQVMRELLDGTASLPSKLDPGFAFQDVDTTTDFFHVDYLSGENDPYYNGDDAGLDTGVQGNAVSFPIRSARMDDTPNYTNGTFPAGTSNMKYEFRTAAFSHAGKDAGSFYRFVDWTYSKEKGKAAKLKIGSGGSDPGPQFTAAVDLWCSNHGFTLPTPPPPNPDEVTYVVVKGDYLSKIAKAFYGDGGLWPRIYQANRDVIGPNPNLIHPGQELVIP
ncbi:MAG: LysM peptidoglycan-binding domain-containing protein [Gemmataceae bacterium]|nr:LysM peptidoglycan-binding domain-containing protein [Gemmataceae bacterium]MCI0737528.1 LysM peptidoglycan-binding domain-containing protein [Gemmataceae bacterium]